MEKSFDESLFFCEWKHYIKQEEELRGGVRVQYSGATCVAAVAFRLPLVSVDCGPQSATPLPLLVSRLSAACTISLTGPHKTPQKHSRAPQYTTYITSFYTIITYNMPSLFQAPKICTPF